MGSDHHVDTPGLRRLKISIHAPRVGSDALLAASSATCSISIHAPRVGSDFDAYDRDRGDMISIHAPRVGSDFDALGASNVLT